MMKTCKTNNRISDSYPELAPTALAGTSPKYEMKSSDANPLLPVVFGGGWEGASARGMLYRGLASAICPMLA